MLKYKQQSFQVGIPGHLMYLLQVSKFLQGREGRDGQEWFLAEGIVQGKAKSWVNMTLVQEGVSSLVCMEHGVCITEQ